MIGVREMNPSLADRTEYRSSITATESIVSFAFPVSPQRPSLFRVSQSVFPYRPSSALLLLVSPSPPLLCLLLPDALSSPPPPPPPPPTPLVPPSPVLTSTSDVCQNGHVLLPLSRPSRLILNEGPGVPGAFAALAEPAKRSCRTTS